MDENRKFSLITLMVNFRNYECFSTVRVFYLLFGSFPISRKLTRVRKLFVLSLIVSGKEVLNLSKIETLDSNFLIT